MSFTTYLNSYMQIWRSAHFWRPAMVLRYTFCFDPYWNIGVHIYWGLLKKNRLKKKSQIGWSPQKIIIIIFCNNPQKTDIYVHMYVYIYVIYLITTPNKIELQYCFTERNSASHYKSNLVQIGITERNVRETVPHSIMGEQIRAPLKPLEHHGKFGHCYSWFGQSELYGMKKQKFIIKNDA